jgi:hypothetical protein
VHRASPARGIDGADQDADGLVAWLELGKEAGGRHRRHGGDAETKGGVEAIGQVRGLLRNGEIGFEPSGDQRCFIGRFVKFAVGNADGSNALGQDKGVTLGVVPEFAVGLDR